MTGFQLDTSGEEWRAVVGYEGLYEVSSRGSVRSLPRVVSRLGRPTRVAGMPLRLKQNRTGYTYINISRDGEQKAVGVHRLVAGAFLPNPAGKLVVNHRDNDRRNNRLENLEWLTPQENVAHKCAQLRGRGRLTLQDLSEIREAWPRLRPGEKAPFAARFGITGKHLWKIGTGRAHMHVPHHTPFVGGYIAALRGDLPAESRDAPLAPETLALILKDCERFEALYGEWPLVEHGRGFWSGRQRDKHSPEFPPLTPALADDGKVYLREGGK